MKHLRYLAIIPLIIICIMELNGIRHRSVKAQFAYAVTDYIDYSNIPGLKVKPIKTSLTREFVFKSVNVKPCLFIYNSKVYELPVAFFSLHPGGEYHLTQSCGKDITFYYNLIPHPTSAKKLLEQFYYAELKD